MAFDPDQAPKRETAPPPPSTTSAPPPDAQATVAPQTTRPSVADRYEYLANRYREFGGSYFSPDRAEQLILSDRQRKVEDRWKFGPRNILDKFWMNDVQRGPFKYGDASIAPFGVDIDLGDTRTLARGWQRFVGNPLTNTGTFIMDGIENIFENVSRAEAYTLSRTPVARGPYVDPLTWEDTEFLGIGEVLSVNPLAVGPIEEGGSFQGFVAEREVDARVEYENIFTAQRLEEMGFGSFDEFWLEKKNLLIQSGSGVTPLFVPEDFKLTPDSYLGLLAGPQGERVAGTTMGGDLLGEFIVPVGPLKLPKWLRQGTKGGKFAGVTNRNAAIGRVNDRMAKRTDEALDYVRSDGASGRKTAELSDAEAIVRADSNTALELDFVKGKRGRNPNALPLAGVIANIDNIEDALIFNAAIRGSAKHYDMLVERRALAADAIARAKALRAEGVTQHEKLWLNKPEGFQINPLLKSNLDGIPNEALADDAMRQAEKALGLVEDELYIFAEYGMQPVSQLGMNSIIGKRLANAWRAGRAKRDAKPTIFEALRGGKKPRDPETVETSYANREDFWTLDDGAKAQRSVSGVEELSFKVSSNFRQVGVWKWINGSRGSGYANIFGDADYDSLGSVVAAVTDAKVVRKNPAFIEEVKRIWVAADTPSKRLAAAEKIERMTVELIAKDRGLDVAAATKIYEHVSKRRRSAMDALKQRNGRAFAFDPETGKMILAHPTLVSQLERSIPLLDFGAMDRSIRRATNPVFRHIWSEAAGESYAKSLASTGVFFDELNSLWKANVLLRLGYTQRNLAEGWLRSLSYLGAVPALEPANVVRGSFRMIANYRNRGRKYGDWQMQKNNEAIVNAQVGILKEIGSDITRIKARIAAAKGKKNASKRANLKRQQVALEKQRETVVRNIDTLQDSALRLQENRAKLRKRRMFDEEGEAFSGPYGDLRRQSASANQTVENFLQGRRGRATDMWNEEETENWVRVNPGDENYLPSLVRAGEQLAADNAGRIALRVMANQTPAPGQTIQQVAVQAVMDFLQTPTGRADMKKLGVDAAKINSHAHRVVRIVDNYLPNPTVKKLFLEDVSPTTMEVSVALGRSKRNPIHGASVRSITDANQEVSGAYSKLNEVRKTIFEWLGSKPESFLVRHPFYAEVYAARKTELFALARSQGRDMSDELGMQIEKASHRAALKATDDIMFTITRYSNPAGLMKFLSPFFAAWENSMRVWGHIVLRDPSILYRGAFLWDYPNRMGLVYDYEGNRIPSDKWGFIRRQADDGLIMMPKYFSDAIAERLGGNTIAIPKEAMNVISPGEPPWLPGLGEFILMPIGAYLSSRPDTADRFRDAVGEDVFRQFVPFGTARAPQATDVLGGWIRKAGVLMARPFRASFMDQYGESYTRVLLATQKNMMVEHLKNGGTYGTRPSLEEAESATDIWFAFSMLASGVSPVAHTRISQYHTEINTYRRLMRQYPMDIAQQKFIDQFGPEVVPLMVSSMKKNVSNIRPELPVYKALKDNEDLFRKYDEKYSASVGPGVAASVIAQSIQRGEFDPIVYEALRTNTYSKTGGTPYAQFQDPAELVNEFILTEKWITYNKQKAEVDALVDADAITATEGREMLREFATRDTPGEMMDPDNGGEAWKATYDTFIKTTPAQLQAVYSLSVDDDFRDTKYGVTEIWDHIDTYYRTRADYMAAIDAEIFEKDEAKDLFASWSRQYRNVSLEFSDFWDRYFESDDLTAKIKDFS